MKKIKIAHLYYDLMNLYGENGNIVALRDALMRQEVDFEITNLTINNKINFEDYDIFYMGCGTENNLELVRQDILKYKEDIKKYVKKKIFIITGNAYDLFGISINEEEALGIFKYKSTLINNRVVGEQVYSTSFLDNVIVGFQNRSFINTGNKTPLFNVISGYGFDEHNEYEGIKVNNFYGTYTLGPLLIRNPHLTDYILKELFRKKKIHYKEITDTPDYKAYYEYLKNFNIKTGKN